MEGLKGKGLRDEGFSVSGLKFADISGLLDSGFLTLNIPSLRIPHGNLQPSYTYCTPSPTWVRGAGRDASRLLAGTEGLKL